MVAQPEELEGNDAPKDAYGSKLTFYIPNVQVQTFFYDSFGHKLAFKRVARGISNLGGVDEMMKNKRFGILGKATMVGMGLALEPHGKDYAIVRRCPRTISQILAGYGLFTTNLTGLGCEHSDGHSANVPKNEL
eukprot:3466974-Amphidinium_carterae.1